MPSQVTLTTLSGDDVAPVLDAVAALRISVFAEWPYCYAGSVAYERDYLQTLAQARDAIVVVAKAGDQIVGASTALPLTAAPPSMTANFPAHGYDIQRGYYLGESVLLPRFRGMGVGVGFFAHRLAHAARGGAYDFATFCGVVRSVDDPRRPQDWQPLDGFWRARGFAPVQGLTCDLAWPEHGENREHAHRMQFWARFLLED